MRVYKNLVVVDLNTSESESEEEEIQIKLEPVFDNSQDAVDNTISFEASELVACRVCLSTDVKLYNLYECNLDETFSDFTGMPVSPRDGLPQHLCIMCRALLLKSVAFRDRCRNTQSSLRDTMVWSPRLTTANIRFMDKTNFELPLTITEPLIMDFIDSNQGSDGIIYPQNLPTIPLFITTANPGMIIKNEAIEFSNYKHVLPDTSDIVNSNVVLTQNNMALYNDTHTEAAKITNRNEKTDMSTSTHTIEVPVDSIGYNNYRMETQYFNTHNNVPPKTESTEIPSAKVTDKGTQKDTKNIDYDKFSDMYEVDIVYPSIEEQIEELAAKRNCKKYKKSKFKCELCYQVFASEATCSKHKERHEDSFGENQCEICQLRFSKRKNMTDHMRAHNRMRYKCRHCGHISKVVEAAIRHYRTRGVCVRNKFDCKHCQKVFNHRGFLESHTRLRHTPQLCADCGSTFGGTFALRKHMRKAHGQVYKCKTCNEAFRSKVAMDKHECNMRSCGACGEGFADDDQLKKHRVKAHLAKACVECDFVCTSEKKLDAHWNSEHKGRPRPGKIRRPYVHEEAMCDICAKLVTKGQLENHRQTHSNEKTLQCSFCEKRFRLKWHLREHETRHTGERPLKCSECPATFSTYDKKSQHKAKVHMGKKYQCGTCKQCFINESGLKQHELKHTVHMCAFCSKRFSRRIDLKVHMKKHKEMETRKDDKPKGKPVFRCKICPATFPTLLQNLNHRAQVHNERRLYQCDTCGKGFLIKFNLVKHLKTHTVERPFKCTACPKTYQHDNLLKEHMHSHTGAKPYKCPLCPEHFNSFWKRYEHRMRVHLKKPIKRKPASSLNDEEIVNCGTEFSQSLNSL